MTKRMTCGDCKHWEQMDQRIEDGIAGTCLLADENAKSRDWKRDSFEGCGYEYGFFKTGPDFSCIHWEKK